MLTVIIGIAYCVDIIFLIIYTAHIYIYARKIPARTTTLVGKFNSDNFQDNALDIPRFDE